jgi:stage II sporulation protein D
MKKIFFFFLVVLLVPTGIIFLLLREKEPKKNGSIIHNGSSIEDKIVRVKRVSKDTIEEVPLEDYVVGVVSGEMPISFSDEALKAQAVCARTYVIRKMDNNKDKEYDVVDTIDNQVYQDLEELKNKWKEKYDENIKKLKKIVKETEREYLTYDGKVIEVFFFSTSNGHTENSEEVFTKALPYLKSVDSSFDEEVSPVFKKEVEMSLSDFYTKLSLPYAKQLEYKVLERTQAGSVKKIRINGEEYKGTEVRKLLGIRSTYFEFIVNGTNVLIKTTGYGHGVGMSQYGALALSNKGYTYDKILKYYYQGVEIQKIS